MRMTPTERRNYLKVKALKLAGDIGFMFVTTRGLAKFAGVSPGLIHHHFFGTQLLQKSIMLDAVKQKVLPVIAQGLVFKNRVARRAPKELRVAALASIK